MYGAIFKETTDIKAEDIIKEMTFRSLPDYGDVMSLKEFKSYNDSGCIIDDDGSGYIVYNKQKVSNSTVWCFNQSVLIGNKYILPYESLVELFGDDIMIIWFNK